LAVNAFIPVIPATRREDRSNALSLTAEFSRGSGIAEKYTLLTGGARFPLLVNPGSLVPAPIYRANVDEGLVTFDADLNLRSIDWQGLVLGIQYHLPIDGGRIWVSANYSRLESSSLSDLTPRLDHGSIFTEARYFDANLYFAITPELQLGLSFQRTEQQFGDGVRHHNQRSEGALSFFF
jgi:hypothetical protein